MSNVLPRIAGPVTFLGLGEDLIWANLWQVPKDGKPREPTIVVDCGGMTIVSGPL
jgi:hypothetical protein